MKRGYANNAGVAVAMVLLMVISSLAILPNSGGASEEKAEVRADNVLNIAIQDDITTLNPCKASGIWTWDVIGWFYDSTIGRNKDMEMIPWMAGNWTYSPENPTWANLTLRNDIKWHDGEPMDGNDLVFTYNFFAGAPGYGAQVPRYLSSVMPLIWDNDSDGTPDWVGVWVDPDNPYLVHYHLSEQSATFVTDTLAMFVLPEHIWKEHTGDDKFSWPTDPADYQKATVGTGLFKFSRWERFQYIELDSNDDYFKGWPGPDHITRLRFSVYQSTDAAVMALQNGEIDYIAWTIPPGYMPQLRENTKISLSRTPELGYTYMGWNLRKEPFNLLPFRQAMAHCTDKQTIVSRLLLNYGTVGTSIESPANKLYFNDSVTTYDYDLDAANAILDAQGWNDTDGDGWRELPGIGDSEIVILTLPHDYDPYFPTEAKMIADSCKEIGLNVVSKPADFRTIFTRVYEEHDFDAYILSCFRGLPPVYQVGVIPMLLSSFDISGGYNGAGVHNDTLDAMLYRMQAELNETERIKIWKDIQESVAFNLYYNVLYYRDRIEAYRNDRYIGWYSGFGSVLNIWTLWGLRTYNATNCSIGITGQNKVTDGKEVKLTVKVINEFREPAANISVTVRPTEGSMQDEELVTNADGIAVFRYTPNLGLTAGDLPVVVTFSATADFEVYQITDGMAFSLTVYPPQGKLLIPSLELSQLVATDSDLADRGVVLTVKVQDQNGVAMENASVVPELIDRSGVGEANGTFTGNFTTDRNGEAVITFRCTGIRENGEFIFRVSVGYPDYGSNSVTASLSYVYIPPTMSLTIAVSPESATTGDEITVTVTASDADTGEPLSNVSVALTASEPNATFTPASGRADQNGRFIATMTVSEIGREAETVIITATANATGYEGISQVKEITINRPKETPDISFMGILAVMGAGAIITGARRRRK